VTEAHQPEPFTGATDETAAGIEAVLIVGGGGPPSPEVIGHLPARAAVIAADSGLEHALALGLEVDAVVGDMDSVDQSALEDARRAGVRIDRHPEAKDATDLDLALDAALALRPRRVVVVTGAGDRLDHTLGVALLLASARTAGIAVEAWIGATHVTVVRGEATLRGRPGDLVTLLPVHGPARGIVTDGLLYPLHDEDLRSGSSRGLSNELVRSEARVRVRAGVLLALQPPVAGTHWRRLAGTP
jgi:thiamine pyrophosphokinase